jgi:hypothetical protein
MGEGSLEERNRVCMYLRCTLFYKDGVCSFLVLLRQCLCVCGQQCNLPKLLRHYGVTVLQDYGIKVFRC